MSYTYKIGWSKHNKFYYGVRIAYKGKPENDLWVKYFTSSESVSQFRKEHGEPDIIEIDRVFNDRDEAIEYEKKFISEGKLQFDDNWLNKACWPVVNNRGRKHSEEQNLHHSKVMKGKLKGKKKPPRTKNHTNKIMDSRKRNGFTAWNKGLTADMDDRVKNNSIVAAAARKGKVKQSKSSNEKRSNSLKGRKSPNTGNTYKMTPEQINKRQESRRRNAQLKGRSY